MPKPPESALPSTTALDSPIEISEDRYDRLKLIGWWDQERLHKARVLVVGAGALGNEVIKNLALVGVGRIFVLDFDRIELSNLSRAVLFRPEHCGRPKAEVVAEMARQLNGDCQIFGYEADVTQDIGLGLIREMDVVIGCVDNREARLWVNRMCWKVGTPWIDGGIQEISGVVKTYRPPHGACYECTMTENDFRLMHLRYSCPLLKREDMQEGKVPTAPTIASMIGALQSQEALKLLHDRHVGSGVGMVFNGDANQFYQTNFPRREDCLAHETYDPIIASDFSAADTSAEQLFHWVDANCGLNAEALELDRDFLVEFRCQTCGESETVHKAAGRVAHREATCSRCGLVRLPVTTCEVSREGELAKLSLEQLGVPPFDILKVKSSSGRVLVELGGDRAKVWASGVGKRSGGVTTDGR
ncbi:MAG: ThiF family adenylyltransferase [Pirellulaceae bacterium]|nr:ThiF family adenylyltransferase [Pirellulaceae bacterium]